MKRFYDDVSVAEADGGWQVALDGRGIKTIAGAAQIVPTRPLAEALAAEWAEQTEQLDPKTFPQRDLADYAIDQAAKDPAALAQKLSAYGDTDTLLYRAEPDEPLHVRQLEQWEPLVSAFEAHHAITLKRISGIIHQPQDKAALEVLTGQLLSHNIFVLVGIEAMTSLAASLIIALSAAQAERDAA
ncbi:MAG: ATP12 family protein, partial [Pseudomonadota bacterium]